MNSFNRKLSVVLEALGEVKHSDLLKIGTAAAQYLMKSDLVMPDGDSEVPSLGTISSKIL